MNETEHMHFNPVSEGDTNHSMARKLWDQSHSSRVTQSLLQRDEAVFLHQAMSTPCLDAIVETNGLYITNAAGQRYMDFHGNNVHQLGYNHPKVVQAIIQQLSELAFCPRRFTNEVAIQCAEKLTQICSGELNRVLFAPGGTSVIGMALKLARYVTGNDRVVSLWDSFHGASLDAISVGGEACFRHKMGSLIPNVERIPPAITYRGALHSPDGSDVHYADYLEYVIEKEGGIGVFIAETVRNTDVQVPSKAYWKRIREICDKHHVMLILDEIPNGMGRSGQWFTYQNYGIEPDILCIGKGLGGGIMPIAAMITRGVYNIASDISLGHYTHEKSPLGCAAALASIEVIEENNLLEKVKDDGQFMQQHLNALKDKYPLIGDVRGIGLLWGIELVKNRQTKERAVTEAQAILYHCLAHGLSFKVSQGNVIQLSPPLIITREELKNALKVLDEAIASVQMCRLSKYPNHSKFTL